MYWMYRLVYDRPRVLRDTIQRFYGRWLHVDSEPDKHSFNILLIDRDDVSIEYRMPGTIHIYAPIRKLGARELVRLIEKGRAYIRTWVTWVEEKKTYRLGGGGLDLEGFVVEPAFDVFLAQGLLLRLVEENTGCETNALLALKKYGGLHLLYSGRRAVAEARIPDRGTEISIDSLDDAQCIPIDAGSVAEANRDILEKYTMVSRKFLKSLGEPDIVVVSFSGGKDSVVVLDLAVRVYGRDRVIAIYSDTGVDMPATAAYIEHIERRLGVEVQRVYAGVREEVLRKGLPSIENRWCTLMKTAAFQKALRRLREKHRRVLVLVGDRDSESARRSHKPPVRRRHGYLEAAPIKAWGTLHVQLYHIIHGIPLNPLYRMGFYRLGCYICPALRSLERRILMERLDKVLLGDPVWRRFRREILGSRPA